MLSLISAALAFVAMAPMALAHGGITSYIVDGVEYPGWEPFEPAEGQSGIGRPWYTYDPLFGPTQGYLHCKNNGRPGPMQSTAPVRAGATVVGKYAQWTHFNSPIMAYMANCNGDCSQVHSQNLKWFKIYEAGLLSGTISQGEWGSDEVWNTKEFPVTIPANLAPGNYVLRHEIIVLTQVNRPAFFPNCAQLNVTGTGTGVPSAEYLVSFPGGYSLSEPGLSINIYYNNDTTYPMPGPRLWTG